MEVPAATSISWFSFLNVTLGILVNSRIAVVSDSQKWGFILVHYVLLWQLRWILKEDRDEKDRNSLAVHEFC